MKALLQCTLFVLLSLNLFSQNYSELNKLTLSDRSSGDYFGASIDMTSNYFVVGADQKDINSKLFAGAAYIY